MSKEALIASIGTAALALSSVLVFAAYADNSFVDRNTNLDGITINSNGYVEVRNAQVVSTASSTVTAASAWGSAKITWKLVTDSKTEIRNQYGVDERLSEVLVGHLISFKGHLDQTVLDLTVKTTWIRDWSVTIKERNANGRVLSIDSGAKKFVVKTDENNNVNVTVSDATKFLKENASTTFSALKLADAVLVRGIGDTATNTIAASLVRIYQTDRKIWEDGRVKALPVASTTPTSMVVTFQRFDWTVNIAVDTAVINSNWLKIPLSTIKIGDHIRVYGAADVGKIDATVVRDVSVK